MNTILKENSCLQEKLQELENFFEEAISKKDNEISAIKEKIQRQEEQFTNLDINGICPNKKRIQGKGKRINTKGKVI
jgi:hypothetical protein